MGRKSRLKRERRQLKRYGLAEASTKKLFLVSEHNASVFRFFDEECYAEALLSGKVWISTIETCRQYEDPKQGDAEEAYEVYQSGHVVGGSNNHEFVEIARRSGIHIGPGCTDITVSNCRNTSTLQDAYVLCMTTEFSPEKLSDTFGNYCVEITDPIKFFIEVSKQLENQMVIQEAAAGKVIYKDRTYTGLENPPGPIGFVKPADNYAEQQEFRFLWIPKAMQNIRPFLLECPEIKSICKRKT